ncbi:hypothetical protein [Paenibacillus macquariensis]|uniref:Uncharacterized protein YneF, UPF0154 family n=1 Tax=Paenibacillus macquariensis TaxID=948756 RepID=A0ABY1KCX8_9BACL|nr:hypothetical protein [Paenibacillus macquariensis]MEC0093187.1 hypothetical protein [Paenibacillus macquariensis]OAB35065.1 hypothetical protein PMSM_10805 [Paenibacillus macquariensis subsp. macquariensis]SIR62586.1 Uncharacterized protein YneF, UPF0154 family [Paenibacillus macquariensis]
MNNGESFTAEEFEDLHMRFKEKYPTIDGKPSIPTTLNRKILVVCNGHSNGAPYDLIGRFKTDPTTDLAIKNLADTAYDTALYDNLGAAGGIAEAIMEQKVDEIIKKYYLKMALAPSEQQVTEIYNQMIKESDAAGLPKLEKLYNENYKQRLELWK